LTDEKKEEKKKKKEEKNRFTLKPNFVVGGHQSLETKRFII
jgi:hypothetical protein